MPMVVRFPRELPAGSACEDIVLNLDFAETFLDYAGVEAPEAFQGRSARGVLAGDVPDDWQRSMYYRYWMHDGHHCVRAHYGVRTHTHKLICYYGDGMNQPGCRPDLFPVEWELFDLRKDPQELNNVYDDPAHRETVAELKAELARLQQAVGDEPYSGA